MENSIHDITFVVALAFDSEYRQKNYKIHQDHWNDIGINVIYEIVPYDEFSPFHRTKLFNQGLKKVKTKFAAIIDVDCIFDKEVLENALSRLDDNTFVIPFNKVNHIKDNEIVFHWNKPPELNQPTMDKHFYKQKFDSIIDFELLDLPKFNGPTGLCGMFNLETYKNCGLENEHCIDYAFEDVERIVRMNKLGVKTHWMDAIGVHLWHPDCSRKRNKLFRNNFFEYLKICDMDKEELEAYIKTWH